MNEYGFLSDDDFGSQGSSLQLVEQLEYSSLRLPVEQGFHPVVE